MSIPPTPIDRDTARPIIRVVRKIARWDAVVIMFVLALAAYLYSERPIHLIVTSAFPQISVVERVGVFGRGDGPNLVRNSIDFTAKPWVVEGVTVAPNAGDAPDGTKTATRLAETRTGDWHRILASIDELTPGKTYVLSVFVKPMERSAFMLEMLDVPLIDYGVVRYDLAREQIVHLAGDISGAGIQELTGGWFRLWAAMPYQSAKMGFSVSLQAAPATVLYKGTQGDGALIWGAQLEPGPTLHAYSNQPTGAQQ